MKIEHCLSNRVCPKFRSVLVHWALYMKILENPFFHSSWKTNVERQMGPNYQHCTQRHILTWVQYSVQYVVANFQNESCGKSFMTSAAVICNIYYDLIMEFQDMLNFRQTSNQSGDFFKIFESFLENLNCRERSFRSLLEWFLPSILYSSN